MKLHFQDIDALARFDRPDRSHIDQKDKPAFTCALLAALESRGMTWDKPEARPRPGGYFIVLKRSSTA